MGLTLECDHQPSIARDLPEPEAVFLSWLLSQPSGADLATAVDVEIRRLERYRGSHAGPARLGALFEALRRSLEPGASRRRLQ